MKKTKILIIAGFVLTLLLAFPMTTLAIASGDVCNDINDALGGVLDCGNEDVTSFSGFEGGLSAPTGEGLSSTLQQAKTAREFIVNTLNFVLSFLGVIAMAIVIYGGFLYITAAGNEEQSGKGKKAITYAAVGILVIIGSFAIVNTLLRFGGGTTTDRNGVTTDLRGSGMEGSNIGQQVIYNLGAIEINNSLNDFVNAYRNLVTVNTLLKKVLTLQRPAEHTDNSRYLSEVSSTISEISNRTNSLSKAHTAAQSLLEGWIAETRGKDLLSAEFEDGKIKDLFEAALKGEPAPGVGMLNSGEVISGKKLTIDEANKADFNAALDELVGPANPTDETASKGRLAIIQTILGPIASSPASDALQRGLISEKDISRAFAGIDANTTVSQLFQNALKNIKAARSLADDPTNTDLLINSVKSMEQLYIIVKDIKFTYVKITASGNEGNAPFMVELSGLESRDPTGLKIPDENYSWDPDGDGEPGPKAGGAVECNSPNGQVPTIACTYNQPGTYVVSLSIKSNDPQHTANGIAYLPIQVRPSVAMINLKASIGSMTENLRKFEKDAKGQWRMTIDKNELHATTDEAKQTGINFDASASRSGSGQELKFFSWMFRDGSQPEQGASKNKIEQHKYAREGKYPLILEVTDAGNHKDRKIINVVVSSLAARIETKKTLAESEELLEFDGSLSKSDQGIITSYKWSVLNKDGEDITKTPNEIGLVGDAESPVLRVKFKKPGSYNIQLTVADGSQTAQTTIPISIKSRKPRAAFTIKSCQTNCPDITKPSIVDFDGSSSFDPDAGDIISYDWSFYTEKGDKLEPGTGFIVIGNTPLSGPNAKKIRIQLLSVGRFKAVLHVNDSHTDLNIRQEDSKNKLFQINSVVEAAWDPGLEIASQLKDGKATLAFKGTVRQANRIQIDYGDFESDEAPVKDADVFSFTHDYAKAGEFKVALKAISDENKGANTITKRVYIAGGDSPIAAMEVYVDGSQVILEKPSESENPAALEIIRDKLIKFDASHSVNSKGKTDGLKFSWDFGDHKPGSTGKTVNHSYEDVSPDGKPFTVTLTVSETDHPDKQNQSQFFVKVVSKKPMLNALSLEKKTQGDITPIDVTLVADGATDPDGRITNYQFWYYDPAFKDKKFSVVDTQLNRATLTVETNGEENEGHEYLFCVSLTDNDNNTADCGELLDEDELPKLEVKNGANKPPKASFAVDHTSVKVSDVVTFTSTSTDPDDRIVKYYWDFEGVGFQNINPTESSVITHAYKKKSPTGGYKVKLKAVDERGAAGYSPELSIVVDSASANPIAAFSYEVSKTTQKRVKFYDNSVADTKHGATLKKWKWDFDIRSEFGCDKEPKSPSCNDNPSDDTDSIEQNPVFDYPESGTYTVKLAVEDNLGGESEPKTLALSVIGGISGSTDSGAPKELKADIRACYKDCPSELGSLKFESVNGQTRKVLHLPETSQGESVILNWGNSTGDIVSYKVDKNIYCDSDKNGNRADDTDNPDTILGSCALPSGQTAEHCWKTYFGRYFKTGFVNDTGHKESGHFSAMLTTQDRNGKLSMDNIDIIFDGPSDPAKVAQYDGYDCNGNPPSLLKGAIIEKLGTTNTILLVLFSGVIIVLIGIGAASYVKGGRRRE